MQTQLKFRCPQCNVGLNAKAEKAGRTYGCPNCSVPVTVPTARALVPVKRPVIVPEVIDDYGEYEMTHHGQYHDDEKPVELRFGDKVGLKVDVDKPTRNVMATTFLGGLLVALGAIVFAMFGGKGKSA